MGPAAAMTRSVDGRRRRWVFRVQQARPWVAQSRKLILGRGLPLV